MIVFGFKWNVRTGYRDLMRDPAVAALIRERADRIAEAAGEGFEADVQPRSGRRQVPRGSVRTATARAREVEARTHALERSIDAGR